MIKNTLRTISIAVLIFGSSFSIYSREAKQLTFDLHSMDSVGTNSLRYSLQKPLPNAVFPEEQKGIKKHFFLGVGGGFSAASNGFMGSIKPGLHINGEVGTWITPVSGVRVGGSLGMLSVLRGEEQYLFGSLRADYLVNLTTLLRGYDPHRMFEMIGALGFDYRRIHRTGEWNNNLGLAAAMQMRFNVASSFYLYVEPRLAMLGGHSKFYDRDWRRVRDEISVNVGVGYRILQGSLRKVGASTFEAKPEDQIYFGLGGGLWGFPRLSYSVRNVIKNGDVFGEAFVGKQFSPLSALQLTLNAGRFVSNHKARFVGIGSLDYVLNFNNLCGGYHPNEVFQLLINAGVAESVVTRATSKALYSTGLSLGFTGLFRITDNWAVYVHPQAYMFGNKFSRAVAGWRPPMTALNVGVRYSIGDFSRNFPLSYEEFNANPRHWFLTTGIGWAERLRGSYGHGGDFFVGFGQRFTPISSWRVQVVGDIYPRSPLATNATVHLDYMSSITTAMYGYNPNRLFDLALTVGGNIGFGEYDSGVKFVGGIQAGLQANFRINDNIDLYVEPQMLAVSGPKANGGRSTFPEARVQLGVRYKISPVRGYSGDIEHTVYGEKRNFASLSGYPMTLVSTAVKNKSLVVSGGFDVSAGRWFTMVSGARLTYACDWISRHKATHHLSSIHADYLLNVVSLFDRTPSRKWHVIGALGLGIGISPDAEKKCGAMGYTGVQVRYNLPWNIDVHIEPGANFWSTRALPYSIAATNFEMGLKLAVGASYRF